MNSYDEELDDDLRLRKVVNPLKKAMKIPYDKYKEICEHNKSNDQQCTKYIAPL